MNAQNVVESSKTISMQSCEDLSGISPKLCILIAEYIPPNHAF